MEQEPDTQEDAILKIIEKVDNNFEKRLRKIYFSRKTEFSYFLPFITLIFYLVIFMIAAYLLVLIVRALPSVSEQPPSTQIAVLISITAAFIALASFGVNLQNLVKPVEPYNILFEYNYKVLKDKMLKENMAGENVALLKGLVMLKSKHPELSLMQVLDFPITKDKLFEILYK